MIIAKEKAKVHLPQVEVSLGVGELHRARSKIETSRMTATEGPLNGLLLLEREEAKGLLWPAEKERSWERNPWEQKRRREGARVRCRERI